MIDKRPTKKELNRIYESHRVSRRKMREQQRLEAIAAQKILGEGVFAMVRKARAMRMGVTA